MAEEAVHLLRSSPPGILACYYLGSLPFVLGFLFFWADMSRGAFAERHCVPAALGLALLFVWMTCWQAVFVRRLKGHVLARKPEPWTSRSFLRMVMIQTIVHSSSLVVLPLASILLFPLGVAYAFYQNTFALADYDRDGPGTACRRSWQQALIWPKQNHIMLLIFALFGLFVFVNLVNGILAVPQLMKMFFGTETMFTRNAWSMLNTTFFAVIGCLTYLCMDPLAKAAYLLRCFYGESLRSGTDLKVEIRNVKARARTAAVVLVFLLAFQQVLLAGASPPGESPQGVDPRELDQRISEVIQQPEYSWRMPREKTDPEEDKGLLAHFMDGVLDTITGWYRGVVRFMERIADWFGRRLPEPAGSRKQRSGSGWITRTQGLIFVLLAAAACTLAILLRRLWLARRRLGIEMAGQAVPAAPDITDESIVADELPADRWLMLGRELLEKGELRLALRAFYLSSLARLARGELITIARFKSNRDYQQELTRRRGRAGPQLLNAFAENVVIFERIWYGMHEVTRDLLAVFDRNQERIIASLEE